MSWIENDPTISIGKTALAIESNRLKIIGSNLANAAVPKFRALKCNFNRALSQTLKPDDSEANLVATNPLHFSELNPDNVKLPTEEEKVSTRVDQNTVDVESELSELSKLQIRYRASLNAISHRVKLIKIALESTNG